jgi:hypothetical protein
VRVTTELALLDVAVAGLLTAIGILFFLAIGWLLLIGDLP